MRTLTHKNYGERSVSMLPRYIIMFSVSYCLYWSLPLLASSNVYGLKIRTSFDTPPELRDVKSKYQLTVLPIFNMKKRHITSKKKSVYEHKKVIEDVINIRYGPSKYWWLELTTGVGNEQAKYTGNDKFKTSHIGLDDFVFEGGHRFFIGDNVQFSLYGLVGLPVHRKVTLDERYDPLVGVRVYRFGAGAELSLSFLNKLRRSVSAIVQARFIHGFKRSWFPILPHGTKIQPGNFTDLLLAIRFRKNNTLIEVGYSGTFFTNQAIVSSTKKIHDPPHLSNNGYINIQHSCRTSKDKKPFIVSGGLSGGGSKYFHEKVFAIWLAVTLLF